MLNPLRDPDWYRKREKELEEEIENLKLKRDNLYQWSKGWAELDKIIKRKQNIINQKIHENWAQTAQTEEENKKFDEEWKKREEERQKIWEEKKERLREENERKEQEIERENAFRQTGRDTLNSVKKHTGNAARGAANVGGNFLKQRWQNRQQRKQEKKEEKERRKEELKNETLKDREERKKHERENKKARKEQRKEKRDEWKERLQRRGGDLFIILALLVHFMKFGFGFSVGHTWYIDIAFAIFVWSVIFGIEDKNSSGIRSLVIVLALEILLPLLIGNISFLQTNKFVHYYLVNRLLTPWWFYFAIIWYNNSENPSRFAKITKLLVVLFWIGVILGSLPAVTFSKMSPADYVGQQQSDLAIDFYHKSLAFWSEDVYGAIKGGFLSIGDAFEKQMAVATGGYYTGMVDKNSDKKLGVYIERVKPTSPEFFYDSPVSVHGQVEVMSLDDSVLLNISCYRGAKDEKGDFKETQKANQIYPEEANWYYNLEKEQVDCVFEPRYLDRGSHKITITSDFNFETMAYQKSYFMNKQTMRTLIGEGKDPLSQYDITDKNPQAKYTSGPVKIGMDISSQPTAISKEGNSRPRLGVTIESNTGWQGQIKKLKELMIQVPDSMSLDVNSCNYEFESNSDMTKEEALAKFRSEQTEEFEACLQDTNMDKSMVSENGIVSSHPATGPSQETKSKFNDCLQEKAEERVSSSENKDKIIKGYKEYRSSQFRDCQEKAGIKDSCFKNDGTLKDKCAKDANLQTFNNCLKDYADKETEGYHTYYLDVEKYGQEFKNIDRYKTFSCRINIDNEEEILDGRPISTKYFRARARYDYQLEKSTRVQVIGSGATEPYELPKGTESQHIKIRNDYGNYIKNSIDKINDKGKFNEKLKDFLTPCLIQAQIIRESGGDPEAINPNDPSYGLMQIMKPTKDDVVQELKDKEIKERSYNPDLMDPQENILIGTYYLAKRINNAIERGAAKEDVLKYALAEYNHGVGNMKKCIENGRYINFDICFDRLPGITQKYQEDIIDSMKLCAEGDFDKTHKIPEEKEWDDSKLESGTIGFNAKYKEIDIDDCIYLEGTAKYPSPDDIKKILYASYEKKNELHRVSRCAYDKNDWDPYTQEQEKQKTIEQCKSEVDINEDLDSEVENFITDKREYEKLKEKIQIVECVRDKFPKIQKKQEDFGETKLKLIIEEQQYNTDENRIKAKLVFNDMITMGEETFTKSNEFSNFGRNPFVQVKFNGCTLKDKKYECELDYKYASNFIQGSDKIGLDEEKPLNSLIDIRFDDDWGPENSIILKNKEGREFCSIDWPIYSTKKKCIDENFPYGLGITVRDKFDPRVGKEIREDNINVQIEYDITDFEADCCSEPDTCEGFELRTCKEEIFKENVANDITPGP
ncbi:MAG: transglycosylase SLT domain-containing protein [Nanobdellota archaeon]